MNGASALSIAEAAMNRNGKPEADAGRRQGAGRYMYVIAGLGNPGRKYEGTRHNCGFAALDILADSLGIRIDTAKFHGLVGEGRIEGTRVLLVKPQTFMNLSGECLRDIVRYYPVDPEKELIVLCDDVSLAPGQLRVRLKGSAGGHNGLKSIIACLGTQDFARVKIGVGQKPVDMNLADYVLGRFPLSERVDMIRACDRAARAAAALVTKPADQVMNEFNVTIRTRMEPED